jgi:hypothetical protein
MAPLVELRDRLIAEDSAAAAAAFSVLVYLLESQEHDADAA